MASIKFRPSKKIKMLRVEKGWSQRELAKRVGVSQPHIWRYEKGVSTPNLIMIEKLCTVFGASPDKLLI